MASKAGDADLEVPSLEPVDGALIPNKKVPKLLKLPRQGSFSSATSRENDKSLNSLFIDSDDDIPSTSPPTITPISIRKPNPPATTTTKAAMAPSDHAITPPEEGQSVTASFDLSSIPALRDLTYTTPLARARAIKATLTKSQTTSTDGIISVLQSTAAKPSFRKKRVEDDPENHIIKSLREAGFEWGSIANILNSERVKRGEEPTFTQPAVYSRFVRNAPKIAAAAGEVGFDPKDFMHIRHPHHYSGFEASGTVKRMGVKVEIGGVNGNGKRGRGAMDSGDCKTPTDTNANTDDPSASASDSEDEGEDGGDRAARMHLGQSHNNVRKKAKLSPDTEELETADLSEMLAKAVERVQRNIWAFVADEMERATGKLYEPRALESRFRAL